MISEAAKKVIVFAGTKEGRILCELLARHKVPVTACVATEYGSLCLQDIPGLKIREGRLTQPEIRDIIADCDYIVDATHPYAKLITENIKAAVGEMNKTYLRIIRPSTADGSVIECESLGVACEYLNQVSGKVLITTGSKELLPYTGISDYQERLFVRVLPSVQSLTECINRGFKPSNIICMQGPFSEEINIAMIKQTGAAYLVTKDTGVNGGFDEKISAAVKCNAKVIVIDRPAKEEGFTLEAACEFFREEFDIKESKENSYFPFFMKLRNKKIVVVGAGNIAVRRIKTLLEFEADITVIAPEFNPELRTLNKELVLLRKNYEEQDLEGAFIVVAATNDRGINQKIAEDAGRRKILVNRVDQKEQSDFYFPAIFSDENIVGGIISKNGENHRLVKEKAVIIRDCLSKLNDK